MSPEPDGASAFARRPTTRSFRILHTDSSTAMGGQEIRILGEAAGMVRRGHAAVLAVQPGSWLEREAARRGLPVEPILQRQSRYPALLLDFLRLISKHRIQIVNTHGSLDSWTASIAGRLSGEKPIVIRTRHKSTPISPSLRHRILYKRLPHAIITTGETVRDGIIRGQGIAPSRVVSIPTGVDLDVYRPVQQNLSVRTQFGFAPQHVLIGTVAFLRDYKGLDYLIEAAKLVTETHPESRFLIVGDGPERVNLLRKIHDLGLSAQVVFAGFREDIPQLVAAMDIFVVSSVEGEGLPQSLTQAMAMERPVVATAVGSIEEVVKHEVTGLLVPPSNPAALAEQIEVLIRDQALCEKLARAGRELIVQSYSLEHMLDRTEGLYANLLGERYGLNGPNERHGL